MDFCVQEAVGTIPDWLAIFSWLQTWQFWRLQVLQYIPEYLDLMNQFNDDKYMNIDEQFTEWTFWTEKEWQPCFIPQPLVDTKKSLTVSPSSDLQPWLMHLTGAGTAMFDDAMMAKTLCWEFQSFLFSDWYTITGVVMSIYHKTCVYKLRIVDMFIAEAVCWLVLRFIFCDPLMDMEWLILGVFHNPRWSAVWGPRTLKYLPKPTSTFDNLVLPFIKKTLTAESP